VTCLLLADAAGIDLVVSLMLDFELPLRKMNRAVKHDASETLHAIRSSKRAIE